MCYCEEAMGLVRDKGIYEKFFKRPMDLMLSFVGLILLSPILLIISLLIRVKLGTPIIFKQQRPGLNEKIFTIYKFKTMTNEKDGNGKLLPDSERLTKFGKWLRSTSLDELPELWNILKGDMSIVGPRPLLVEYLPLYNEHQRRRHEIRPGLTGLAQVNGRNAISWEEKFEYDVKYVDNPGLFIDLKIFILTLKAALTREGINFDSYHTMKPFRGSDRGLHG